MPEIQDKTNLLGLSREGMQAFFADLGEKAFRASQVMQWIHQYGVYDFDHMTNISKTLRSRLAEISEIRIPEVLVDQKSEDGTRKWLLQLDSGNSIETVFIPEENRGTLCISSQIGCALECSFCATGKQGFNRNLSTAEIISQLHVADHALGKTPGGDRIITNVVMMGMGEPLLNFDNVVRALDIMMDDFAYGMSRRRVTVSTAGVVPALQRLRDVSEVSLAVSLHAPDDELRNKLVPLNRKYPIKELMEACRVYIGDDNRKHITWEYVMLKGVNDSELQAHALARLLRNIPSKVNLIPFNPFENSGYERSSQQTINRFRDILKQKGIVTITRRTRGDDIDAACGQLAGRVSDKTKRSQRRVQLDAGGQA